MLQYILTGLAGIALGIVAMRVWQARGGAAELLPDAQPAGGQADAITATPVEQAEAGKDAASRRTRRLLAGSAVLAALAVGILIFRPFGGEPKAAPNLPTSQEKALADVETMISRLAARLKTNPDDGEGFRMLGWSYVMTGKPELAIKPYKRALVLLPENALVHAGYGEALTGIAGGTVPADAKAEFDKAHAIDPKEPRARYFIAMWQSQHGEKQQALDQWIALANDGPGDATWQADLHNQITKLAADLGVDVSARLKQPAPVTAGASGLPQVSQADIAAAKALPADQQQAMINSMVDGLAEKLKTDPGNVDGWVQLLRSRMVLKQADKAAQDLVAARKALAGNSAGLARVNASARDSGVPGA